MKKQAVKPDVILTKKKSFEFGLRPVGAIGAYAPEGIRNAECGSGNVEMRIQRAD
jgi:hypothetical protein